MSEAILSAISVIGAFVGFAVRVILAALLYIDKDK